jgi:hypothetical protein
MRATQGSKTLFLLQTTGPHSKRLSAIKPIHGCRRARAWAIGKLKNTTAAAVAVVNAETSPNNSTHNRKPGLRLEPGNAYSLKAVVDDFYRVIREHYDRLAVEAK